MSIPKKQRGERIAASEWNQVADVVNQRSASDARAEQTPVVKAKYIHVYSSNDILPYSVFGICSQVAGGSYTPGEPTIATVRAVPFGSYIGLFTNDSIEIKAGTFGHARPIGNWSTTRLRATGGISIGHPCGVKPGTFTIEAGRYGFACVAASIESGCVEVIQTGDPPAIIGEVYSAISAFDQESNALGSGYVKMLHRVGSASYLTSARDPNTQIPPWLFPVYSLSREEIESGVVIATNVLGVGLVVEKVLDEYASSSSSYSFSTSTDECEPFELIVAGGTLATKSSSGRLRIPYYRLYTDSRGCLHAEPYLTFSTDVCDCPEDESQSSSSSSYSSSSSDDSGSPGEGDGYIYAAPCDRPMRRKLTLTILGASDGDDRVTVSQVIYLIETADTDILDDYGYAPADGICWYGVGEPQAANPTGADFFCHAPNTATTADEFLISSLLLGITNDAPGPDPTCEPMFAQYTESTNWPGGSNVSWTIEEAPE